MEKKSFGGGVSSINTQGSFGPKTPGWNSTCFTKRVLLVKAPFLPKLGVRPAGTRREREDPDAIFSRDTKDFIKTKTKITWLGMLNQEQWKE